MICSSYPSCRSLAGGCQCSGLLARVFEAQRREKDWAAWAERHGYVHAGYVNGKPHLVKAQVRR